MEVSTRGRDSRSNEPPDVGVRLGARHAARLSALFTPSFLALLPLAISLLTLPWLDSPDVVARHQAWLGEPHPGAQVIATVAVAARSI